MTQLVETLACTVGFLAGSEKQNYFFIVKFKFNMSSLYAIAKIKLILNFEYP